MAKRIISLVLSIFFAFCMSSCAKEQPKDDPSNIASDYGQYQSNETPKRGGTLNLCIFEVDSINPLLTQNDANLDALRLVFDGLFSVYDDFSVQNNLCQSYTISEDGLNYSFVIKDGISFHDGTGLTALDVDASFKLIQSAQGPYSARFECVESTSTDAMVWNVKLKEPVINFTALLDFPVLPKSDAHMSTSILDTDYVPNGTGLFKVNSYKVGKELHLTINENHFSGKVPYIPDIKIAFVGDRETAISMFENLQSDVLSDKVLNLEEDTPKRKYSKTVSYPKNTFTFLGINNQKPVLLDSSVRKAIALAIDKTALSEETKTHLPIVSDIPINRYFVGFKGETQPLDASVEKATQLLAESGFYDSDADGILEKDIYDETHIAALDILVNSENQTRLFLAQKIKASLEKVGILASVTAVDFATYTERINEKDYDLFVGSVNISQNNDISFMLQTDKNMFGFSNNTIDLCLNQLKVVTNTEVLESVYEDLCKTLTEQMPVCGLYFSSGVLLSDNKIRGNINPAQSNIFINIHEWFIK